MTARSVLIVGAGLAGARTAETLRSEGFDGTVTIVGDEPYAPYERPALSKEFLAGTREESSLLLRTDSYWRGRDIELMLGEPVVQLDPSARIVRTRSGKTIPFDEIVVATGARPRRLPLEQPLGVHELRTLADAQALRGELVPGARLVVIGGGFVGAEVASTAHGLGVHVTVVEAADAPVARLLGDEVGLMLAERWRRHGVDVRLRVGVAHARADAGGWVSSLLLTDGTELRADAVLVAVGVSPAGTLLPERAAAHVHAAGDVTGGGHWTAAAADGARAARRVLGLPPAAPQPSYVWSDQFGLRLQIVGTPSRDDVLEIDGDEDAYAVRYLDPAGSVTAGVFANRPADAAALRRSLGERTLALAA
jgi:3-phenylpropionate/trans-cinnamate dioxygenase ferredoxin reductase component